MKKGRKYTYIAYFQKENDVYTITIPDLPGVITEANSIDNGIEEIKDALSIWLLNAEDYNIKINSAKSFNDYIDLIQDDNFIQYITVDTIFARSKEENKSVKKTLTIPKWLNDLATAKGVNFSNTLQLALKNELNV